MKTAVIIPFRDRGNDPLRKANLARVIGNWHRFYDTPVIISSDGRAGDEQFCRSAAYNRGVAQTDASVLVFAESDMLIDAKLVTAGIRLAAMRPGLVVPFTQYHYLTPGASELVRNYTQEVREATVAWTMEGGQSIGAINIISREAYDAVGRFDECFDGAWFDDDAMKIAFEVCAGPTNWVTGSAYHLYHKPAARGTRRFLDRAQPTEAERAATQRNRERWRRYRTAHTPEEVRELTCATSA